MSWLILLSVALVMQVSAFGPLPVRELPRSPTSLYSSSTAQTPTVTAAQDYPVKQVVNDQDVVDLASFRNDLTNPEMMVENAGLKSAGVDNTAEALNGIKIGFVYIGIPIALYDFFAVQDGQGLQHAIEIYFGIGGTIGTILGVNSYMGKSVYQPSKAECENRIVVDWAEGLKRKQDVGFVALSPQTTKFEPCGGVCACVDGQLRNSPNSPMGVQTIEGYPAHLHLKNMEVHDSVRRKGVGLSMMVAFEEYARTKTDAEMLTLEVMEDNTAAVQLYEKAGFDFTKNPTSFSKRKFMVKKL